MDLATGTGRWVELALSRGVWATGVDRCPEMLAIAAAKRGVKGRLVCADIRALPFASRSADVAVCSFALGYVDRLDLAFAEMARVARRVAVPIGRETTKGRPIVWRPVPRRHSKL